MEYLKRIIFVLLLICGFILFFHLFIFLLFFGIISYIGYKVYIKITKPKEEFVSKKINNVVIDAEYTER